MPETKRPLKVFLSYASQDKPLVRELSRRLVGEGWIETWQDEKNLLPGQDWRVKIEEAVEEADVVIIVLSQHSVSKEGHVQKELRYAREIALEKPEDTIFLIPLRLDECEVPRGLRFYQWVDYFGERKNEGYASLVESLQLRYEQRLKQEEEVSARQEIIRKEHEAAEKIAREKVEKEAAEKARLEARELAKKKAAKEREERENARKQAEKEAAEKVRLEEEEQAKQNAADEKVERQAARKAAITKFFSNAVPFLRVIGILGIVIVLFWAGLWAVPKFIALIPTPKATVTQRLATQIGPTNSPAPPTKTLKPTSTPTKTYIPTSTIQLSSVTFTTTPTFLPSRHIIGTNLCSENLYLFKDANVLTPIVDGYISPNETFDMTGKVEQTFYFGSGFVTYGRMLETTGPFHSTTYNGTGWILLLDKDNHPCIKFTRGTDTFVLNKTTNRLEVAVDETPTP